ncbi:hypothetical protein ASE00_04775 [Sphingomonas sp. Root710]|uniref:phosphatase PAP2 family protein n=1 Tax=Sphingomonas sp. Root710 TaxID=1736594 RepID=UPI0006F7AEFD|nr:phosphatase PAP2 family protein [Sphingomonas sp. Root710]KRB86060.1 hypothetical protein ASE00_04775 [Sphingomonas sp. Root710]
MARRDIVATTLFLAGLLLIATGLALWLVFPQADLRLLDAARLTSGGRVIAFTRLGGFWILAPFGLAMSCLLLIRGRAMAAIWYFTTVASGRLAVEIIKLFCLRDRPPVRGQLDLVTSWSFPSAHAANTTLTLLALALLLPRRRLALPLAILIAVAMAWSRIALGVHWPGDVMAGLGFGMLWIGIAAQWLPEERQHASSP